MTSEYVTYKAPRDTLTIEKSLEVMKWILDPDSRPYESNNNRNRDRLITRSAGTSNSNNIEQNTVQKQLELQRLILDG